MLFNPIFIGCQSLYLLVTTSKISVIYNKFSFVRGSSVSISKSLNQCANCWSGEICISFYALKLISMIEIFVKILFCTHLNSSEVFFS